MLTDIISICNKDNIKFSTQYIYIYIYIYMGYTYLLLYIYIYLYILLPLHCPFNIL